MSKVRLQRFLAQAGLASRRKAEKLIESGRVSVNGTRVTELGTKVDPNKDKVTLDGKRVAAQDHVWIVLHKPPGTICSTHDPEGRETVLDIVHMPHVRLYPVGRLDYATSGVLLLTNDGQLAEALLHPRTEVARTYHVKVKGLVSVSEVEQIREGVVIDDGQKLKAEVMLIASTGRHTWIEMTIRRGINHQIHRMLEAIEREVLKLVRVEFAGVRADDLPPGKYRALRQSEVNDLRDLCELPQETKRVAPPSGGRRQSRSTAKPDRAPRRKASTKKASTKKASTKKDSTKKASTKKVSTKKASTQKASTKKVSTKKVSTKKASAKKVSAKKASTKKPAAKKNPFAKWAKPKSRGR